MTLPFPLLFVEPDSHPILSGHVIGFLGEGPHKEDVPTPKEDSVFRPFSLFLFQPPCLTFQICLSSRWAPSKTKLEPFKPRRLSCRRRCWSWNSRVSSRGPNWRRKSQNSSSPNHTSKSLKVRSPNPFSASFFPPPPGTSFLLLFFLALSYFFSHFFLQLFFFLSCSSPR